MQQNFIPILNNTVRYSKQTKNPSLTFEIKEGMHWKLSKQQGNDKH